MHNSTNSITTGHSNLARYSGTTSSYKGVSTTSDNTVGYGSGVWLRRKVTSLIESVSKYLYPPDPEQTAKKVKRNCQEANVTSLYTQMDRLIHLASKNPKDPQYIPKLEQLTALNECYFGVQSRLSSKAEREKKIRVAHLKNKLAQCNNSELRAKITKRFPILTPNALDKEDNNSIANESPSQPQNHRTLAKAQDVAKPDVATRPSVLEARQSNRRVDSKPESRKRSVGSTEFRLNKIYESSSPDIALLSADRTIAWVFDSGSRTNKVRLRCGYENGNLQAPMTLNNASFVSFYNSAPAIAEQFYGGGAIAVWRDENGITARFVEPNCTLISPPFKVSIDAGEYSNPKVSSCAHGFLVLAKYRSNSTENWKLVSWPFYQDGTRMSPNEFTTSRKSGNNYFHPELACHGDICVSVAMDGKLWVNDPINIEMSPFTLNGTLIGPRIIVNDINDTHLSPYVMASEDKVTVTWAVNEMKKIVSEKYSPLGFVPGNKTIIYEDAAPKGKYGAPTVLPRSNGDEIYVWIYANEEIMSTDAFYRILFKNVTLGTIEKITQNTNAHPNEFIARCRILGDISNFPKLACTWTDIKSGYSNVIGCITDLPTILLPGMINPEVVSGTIEPNVSITLKLSEFFYGTMNTTTGYPDTIRLTYGPSLKLARVSTGKALYEVTGSELANCAVGSCDEVQMTWDGTKDYPEVTQEICEDGTCYNRMTTFPFFSLNNPNGEQIPLWLIALLVGAGFTGAGVVGFGGYRFFHSKESQRRREAVENHNAARENLQTMTPTV